MSGLPTSKDGGATAIEIVRGPDGREFAIEARPPGPRRGGGDAFSLALDATSWIANRLRNRGWLVEVRPWPTGKPLLTEELRTEADAIQRIGELARSIARGDLSLE